MPTIRIVFLLAGAILVLIPGAITARQKMVAARNPRIASMQLAQSAGARPKFSPLGDRIVFDLRNADGLYDLVLADGNGQLLAGLSQGRPIPQKHAGNGIYRPSGDFIVFQAEVEQHYGDAFSAVGQVPIGEPGVGLFNNLWATNGFDYWQLTNAPVKMAADDGIPGIATVNPRFTWDSKSLVWTERYAEGGSNNWGLWRLKAADFVVTGGVPALRNERVIFTPALGTYVTGMRFMAPKVLLVAGNLDGQHEYGMDLYLLHTDTGSVVRNLTQTPAAWEEGSCVAPSGRVVYMSNQESRFPLDFGRDWAGQPTERDYWIVNPDGTGRERLTYFNDPAAPEYQGWRSVTIICDISPDGRTMAATIGRDVGDETRAWVLWQLWLIRFHDPL